MLLEGKRNFPLILGNTAAAAISLLGSVPVKVHSLEPGALLHCLGMGLDLAQVMDTNPVSCFPFTCAWKIEEVHLRMFHISKMSFSAKRIFTNKGKVLKVLCVKESNKNTVSLQHS